MRACWRSLRRPLQSPAESSRAAASSCRRLCADIPRQEDRFADYRRGEGVGVLPLRDDPAAHVTLRADHREDLDFWNTWDRVRKRPDDAWAELDAHFSGSGGAGNLSGQINTAAEFPEADHLARKVAEAHMRDMRRRLNETNSARTKKSECQTNALRQCFFRGFDQIDATFRADLPEGFDVAVVRDEGVDL